MSDRRLQPGTRGAPAVVTEPDGKHVRIGGYVVPLDFEATSIKEFLLVPFVGACIHVSHRRRTRSSMSRRRKGSMWLAHSTHSGLAETGYNRCRKGGNAEGIAAPFDGPSGFGRWADIPSAQSEKFKWRTSSQTANYEGSCESGESVHRLVRAAAEKWRSTPAIFIA